MMARRYRSLPRTSKASRRPRVPRWVGRSCTEQPDECRSPVPAMTALTYLTSRSKRLRHVRQVTLLAGGSAQLEPAPGSSAQSDIRQSGVTAWNTGLRLGDERPDFRRATKTRPPQAMAFSGRGVLGIRAGVLAQQRG